MKQGPVNGAGAISNRLWIAESRNPISGKATWSITVKCGWRSKYRGVGNLALLTIWGLLAGNACIAYIKVATRCSLGTGFELTMATRGMATRFGYLRQERSFLNWKISPDDVPHNEWLLLLEKNDMEHLLEERASNGPITTEA